MWFAALWALFAALEIAATSEAAKIFWHQLEAMVGIAAMTDLLVFALEYARPSHRTARRTVLGLTGLCLFLIALVATNDLHHRMWTRLWFDSVVRAERGPLGPAVGYGVLVPTVALVIFLRLTLRSHGIYRTQALLLFAGNALPLLAFFPESAGLDPLAPLDPAILVLNITGLLYMFAIYRYGMLGVITIGRDTVFEGMVNAVLILDAEDNLVDLNPAAGARVIATTSSEDKADRLERLGADHVINYRQVPEFDRAVLEWTHGVGVDVVQDNVGVATFQKSLSCIAKGGRLLGVGSHTGTLIQTRLWNIYSKEIQIIGSHQGTRADLRTVVNLVGENRPQPSMDRVLPLGEARAAYEYLSGGDQFGKVVLSIA